VATKANDLEDTKEGLEEDKKSPPPEANLAYNKKAEESNGVIAMIDLLKGELAKENLELEMTEKNAQEDYEKFMADAAAKRAEDSKSITDKEESPREGCWQGRYHHSSGWQDDDSRAGACGGHDLRSRVHLPILHHEHQDAKDRV